MQATEQYDLAVEVIDLHARCAAQNALHRRSAGRVTPSTSENCIVARTSAGPRAATMPAAANTAAASLRARFASSLPELARPLAASRTLVRFEVSFAYLRLITSSHARLRMPAASRSAAIAESSAS